MTETQRTTLEEIKLLALTAGGNGEMDTHAALSRIVRLCIAAGVSEHLSALRERYPAYRA
jgi:hypothetical protein